MDVVILRPVGRTCVRLVPQSGICWWRWNPLGVTLGHSHDTCKFSTRIPQNSHIHIRIRILIRFYRQCVMRVLVAT
ncbi:uncharacterized protein Dsimw501_GD27966, isoform A [Drosophila simulans]|uniref:Uncharacterized protein, isoform A n=1 Tax=Drosophila simulans TaxID=7240 RepID=A0A0J9R386_DROSI|nr:uncharacterized protein Dsimw501_GD27966, isoform A [Drosophila simulans]